MKFEDIISELGEFGPYQKRLYYLSCLVGIPTALQTMTIVFTMGFQKHRCAIPGLANDTYKTQGPWHADLIKEWIPWNKDQDEYSSCELYKGDPISISLLNQTRGCSHYVYDTNTFDSTIFSDVDMVCDDKKLKTYANMIYMAGNLFGSITAGTLSDIVGRKTVLIVSLFGNFGFSLGTAFTTSYAAFVVLRFLTAFSNNGLFLTTFVLGMELVGPKKRKFAGIIIELFWVLGLFVSALMAYFIREWKYLQIASAIPVVFLFSFIILLSESPRWLVNRNRLEEARKILTKIAKGNGVTLSEKVMSLENLEKDGKGEKIWHLFRHKVLTFRSLVIFYNWMVASLVYYGLSLNVGALSGDIYVNFTLSAIVEGASYVFCLLLLDRAGRKPLQCSTMLLAGVACLGTMFPVLYGGEDVKWVTVVLSLIGKFGASAAFAIIYVYSAELFPTPMRNSGMGVSSFTARIGGIAAPYIADLGDMVDGNMGVALPLIIFGGASVLAGLLALLLPETTDRILPDSVHDAVEFGRKPAKNSYTLKVLSSVNGKEEKGKDNPSFHQ